METIRISGNWPMWLVAILLARNMLKIKETPCRKLLEIAPTADRTRAMRRSIFERELRDGEYRIPSQRRLTALSFLQGRIVLDILRSRDVHQGGICDSF